MRFEWDEAKRKANLGKHGFDFADVRDVFENAVVTLLDKRYDYGELRYVSLGILDSFCVAVVHTEDNEIIRVISFRRATSREERYYYEKIRD